MILELYQVSKDYMQDKEPVHVLHDVNFTMEEGEYVAIMGPSGSGKTTLMNIIGCLDQATEGEYYLDDIDIGRCTDNMLADIRLQKIGFVFQNFELLPRHTAVQNVEIPLAYAGVPPKKRRRIAEEALERMGLGDRVNFKVTKLSGGQKQRVAIARAIVNQPQILLADEPTGALDSKSGEQIMELFRELNEEGVTILMITHDREVAEHADRIVTIRDGILKSMEEDEYAETETPEEAEEYGGGYSGYDGYSEYDGEYSGRDGYGEYDEYSGRDGYGEYDEYSGRDGYGEYSEYSGRDRYREYSGYREYDEYGENNEYEEYSEYGDE